MKTIHTSGPPVRSQPVHKRTTCCMGDQTLLCLTNAGLPHTVIFFFFGVGTQGMHGSGTLVLHSGWHTVRQSEKREGGGNIQA